MACVLSSLRRFEREEGNFTASPLSAYLCPLKFCSCGLVDLKELCGEQTRNLQQVERISNLSPFLHRQKGPSFGRTAVSPLKLRIGSHYYTRTLDLCCPWLFFTCITWLHWKKIILKLLKNDFNRVLFMSDVFRIEGFHWFAVLYMNVDPAFLNTGDYIGLSIINPLAMQAVAHSQWQYYIRYPPFKLNQFV